MGVMLSEVDLNTVFGRRMGLSGAHSAYGPIQSEMKIAMSKFPLVRRCTVNSLG